MRYSVAPRGLKWAANIKIYYAKIIIKINKTIKLFQHLNRHLEAWYNEALIPHKYPI